MERTSSDVIWVIVSGALVFLMQAGFLALEAGLTRSKNNINVTVKNLADFCISTALFWAFGYAFMFGASESGLLGTDHFFPDFAQNGSWFTAFIFFQIMFCGTSVTILSGAVAERIRFPAYIVVSAVTSGLTYPIFGHWAWNGINDAQRTGWLNNLGFVDFAGSTVVHSVGGWAALALLLIIGARTGRFPKGQPPIKIPGYNMPVAALGVMLLWFGWFGFNGGSTLGISTPEQIETASRVVANTVLAGSMGLVSAMFFGSLIRGQTEVDLIINGAMGGLIAITAGCFAVSASSAALIGAIGGLVVLGLDALLLRLRIDDAVGAVPAHMGAGVWGTLAVGLFGDMAILDTGLSRGEQIGVQMLGIVVCAAWAFGVTYIVFSLINRFILPLRVSSEQEHMGLNISEHNARTDLQDFFLVMDEQKRTGDLSLRVPVEPFTEIGLIAARYNYVMDTLQEAIARTEAIVRTAMDAIITFSRESLTISSLNPAAETIFGYPPGSLQQQPIGVLLSTMDNPARLFAAAARDTQYYEMLGRRADGSVFPMEVAVTQAHIGAEEVYMGVFRDITERKQAEEELRYTRDAAEAANRAKSTFLANMSHELRTPLNAIIGYTSLVMAETYGGVTEKQKDRLGRVVDNGQHLLTLINDVLDLSKIEAGRMELYLERVQLESLLDNIIEAVRPLIEKNQNALAVTLPENTGSMVADVTKLRQIIFNLLSNASKFTHGGLISLNVSVDVPADGEKTGEWLLFSIQDTGIGMTQEQLGRIFEEFEQADASTTRKYGGTGLGLSLTRRFCEMMGGSISVTSQPEKGTTFLVRLPREVERPATIWPDSSATPPDSTLQPLLAPSGQVILVIDDDPAIQEVMTYYLGEAGYQVVTAATGKSGLGLARSIQPSVITLDVMLPDIDGWSVLALLKADDELANIPVIMLTMIDERGIGYSLGAADYMTKPVQPARLTEILNRYACANPPCAVLVVDDDPSIRVLMRDMLESSGCVVMEAENGQAALHIVREHPPALILLDLMMPEMDGFEFLEHLRQDAELGNIPVVVVTAMDLSNEDRQRLNGSIQHLLQKGAYSRDQLLQEVRRLADSFIATGR